MMDYKESLVYLRDLTKFGFNFGLDRVKELLHRLGNPEKTMTYIHVGGTNGKGSVTSMLCSMHLAARRKTGDVYIPASPFLSGAFSHWWCENIP